MFDWLSDYTLRTVILGSAILGATSGVLGSFAVLRRQSLLGDAVAHSTLPGIVLAFVLTGSRLPLVLLLGAAITGWLSTLLILLILRQTKLQEDAALGISLSVFFGLGIVLMSWVQHLPVANKAGLNHYMFGQAAALVTQDVVVMSVLALVMLIGTVALWKEFKLLAFNPEFGQVIGLPMRRLDITLTALIVIAIVLGLQMVGVVLMSAMLLAPAAAARQWTDRLGVMAALAALFGAIAGVAGTVVSSTMDRMPTGPSIIVAVSVVVVLSLLLAPRRGLVWDWLRRVQTRRHYVVETALANLYQLAMQHDDPLHPHDLKAIQVMMGRAARPVLKRLDARGLAESHDGKAWQLTQDGADQARRMLLRKMH